MASARSSSKAFSDVVQADAINKAMGRKEGGEMVTDIPRWNIRVDGRKFSKYRQLSQKKPRRTLLGLPVADPCSRFAYTVAMVNTVRVDWQRKRSFRVVVVIAHSNPVADHGRGVHVVLCGAEYGVQRLLEH